VVGEDATHKEQAADGADGAGAAPGSAAPSGAADDQLGEAMSQRFAEQLAHDVESPLPWRSIAKKTVMVVVAGITIYLVFPSLAEVFSSFPKLTHLDAKWFALALGLQVAHFACTISLQRIALRTKAWFSVATSQLAGNAISLIVPPSAPPPSSACSPRRATTRRERSAASPRSRC
jgi:hypothetical protein